MQAAVGVLFGDRDNQTQVGLDHLFLGAASLGFTDRHPTVDVLDVGNRQCAFFFQCEQLLLAALNVFLACSNGFGVLALAASQLIGPIKISFIVRKLAQEVCARHACVANADLHDRAFLGSDLGQGVAYTFYQRIVLLGDELDRHEQDGQFLQGIGRLLAAASMLLQRLLGDVELFSDCAEANAGNFRIRTAITFFFFAVRIVLVFVVLVITGRLCRCLRCNWLDFCLRAGCAVIVRVDITAENVGETPTFGGDAIVIGKDAVDGAREMGNSTHHLTNAFLDAFGDFNFAFAGQQFDGTHFTHVHAHGIGGAANVGFDSGKCRRGLFGCGFIGIGFGQQQGIGIRGNLEYIDTHVVDHANDVFHLFRIGNILR